ncbi:biphenyl 2,3-dioxygenase [Pontibacillus chungwhensis BH030062]|uniref:Biphenyl 2,3-dioxygenase n=1 Tax=Pontibacillus chungwhensis BH030062 TaxID=1385513 RepID=A0A0A2V875_9BACI|nr:STAS domain-containing protein [Pontibacillus chungwhensis]KGP89900.1 biphenyl 2,3-dioxygenase [Pontibacillus chungwhensis BH030062]
MEDIVEEHIFNKLLEDAIDHTRVGVTITDPGQPDNPIIYANKGFEHITGYHKSEILGRNCRFLQGEGTQEEQINQLRKAISNEESVAVTVLNHRKNGEPFWNELHIDPVYVKEKGRYYFIGIQKDVSEKKKAEEDLLTSMNEITALSTPIVPLTDGISVLPLIGNMDGDRLALISDRIADKMATLKHKKLIVELSGLVDFDEEVIHGIYKLNDLLQLLGTDLVIAGISPEFAMKSARMGVNLGSIQSFSSVKDALEKVQQNP